MYNHVFYFLAESFDEKMYCPKEVRFTLERLYLSFDVGLGMIVWLLMILHIINRLKDAWSLAAAVDSPDTWNEVAEAALEHADLMMGKYNSPYFN